MANTQVGDLVSGLKSRNAEIRRKCIRDLYQFAKTDLREMPQETLSQVLDEFNHQIHALVSSYDTNEKKAGILTIVCLIGGDTETTKSRTLRYANYLKNIFPSSESTILELAAKTMGRLAPTLGIKRAEFVDSEIKRSLDWLSEERNEGKRLSAVLILKEMAVAMPTYFYQHVDGFFNHIMCAIKDPKEHIRESAGKALRAAFVVTSQRENPKQPHKAHWYQQCYNNAIAALTESNTRERGLSRDDQIHGALIVLNELIRCSNSSWEKTYISLMQKIETEQEVPDDIPTISTSKHNVQSLSLVSDALITTSVHESSICKKLVCDAYEKICTDITTQQISRSNQVHQMLLIIIPRLAACDKEIFAKKHLKSTINHLITFLRSREKDKYMAFLTLGLITVAVESEIKPYLGRIIDIIKYTLTQRDTPRKRQQSDLPIFNSITLLSYALKEQVANVLKELLETLCMVGLSLQLTTCFRELSQNIPSLKTDISDRLLNMLSIILRKKQYKREEGDVVDGAEFSQLSITESDTNKLVLALRTLGTFDFEWQNILIPFIKICIEKYLQSDIKEIRLEAVKTAAKLLTNAVEVAAETDSKSLHDMIDESVSELLSVGLTDFNSDVRFWVFEIFTDPIFDMYLAQVDNLSTLVVAINDEVLEVRELALCNAGRLSNINPSYLAPTLRQLYVQFLIEVQHADLPRHQEISTRMLNNLIVHAPKITRPYIDTILKVFIPKLKDPESTHTIVLGILKAVGDLCDVVGEGSVLNSWLQEIVEILIGMLSDPNPSEKRNLALWCFGQIISATGYVVVPYTEHPTLMDILLGFLKTEQQVRDRRETIRVLGLLGALDPYKDKVNRGQIDFQTTSILIPIDSENDDSVFENINEMLVNTSPLVLDEFYPAIVVTSLMRILRDPAQAHHHTSVVHAITFIFQSLGIKCVPYIPKVIPSMLQVIQTADNENFREFLFTQLAQVIKIVKVHIRNYMAKILTIICEFWPKTPLQPTLIMLLEQIAISLGGEFKVYLPNILPLILRVLHKDTSKDKFITEKLLMALQKFESSLIDVLPLIVPAITRLFDSRDVPTSVSKLALETIEHLSLYLDFQPFSSRIIHPLARVIDNSPALRTTAMNTLCTLILQLGINYLDFIPPMEKVILKHRIQCINYIVLVTRIETMANLGPDDNYLNETRQRLRASKTQEVVAPTVDTIEKLTVNAKKLRSCWAMEGKVSKEDWLEWLRKFSVGLLSESHSPAIRACSTLAQNYSPLASDLFNASFLSCWTQLDENSRRDIISILENALNVPDAIDVANTVLNLAEFMSLCDKGSLPISVKVLGDTAIRCKAYAKAIYYKEQEYRISPSSQVVEALIHINKKLQQKEAANGLLETVIKQRREGDCSLSVHVRWYEKLHNWEQALDLYNKKLEVQVQDTDAKLGKMRCLEALGEWSSLNAVTSSSWDSFDEDVKKKAAKIATAAAWGLQDWDSMKKYVNVIPDGNHEGAFYRAVLAINSGEWAESREFIDQARSIVDAELTAVIGESYQRAYASLVNAQILSELEDVSTYTLVSEKRSVIQQTWWLRLQGSQKVLDDWRRILQVRNLVLSPRDDYVSWLKLVSLLRKNGSLQQAQKMLITILGNDPITNPDLVMQIQDPRVVLAHAKNLWVTGERRFAYDMLQRYLDNAVSGDDDHCRLLARCHLKMGSWCEDLQEINDISIPDILRNYAAATVLAPEWYKAWHSWASMNFEAVLFYKQQENISESSLTVSSSDRKASKVDFLQQYIVPAVEGFFKSIYLSNGNPLQDTLRLLTLWFDYGHHPAIYEVLLEYVRKVEIDIWLHVIPQLIARIDSPRNLVAKLVHSLLIDIGKYHPHALVYPLTVASKSSFLARKTAANQILKTMCSHSQNLVTQAALISEELIRIAILWHEQWFIALDEASRQYFSEKNIKGMFKTLDPLHAMLESGTETLKEQSFIQMYGRELKDALNWCHRYRSTCNETYLNNAWDLYYHVFRRISAQFRSLTSLELQYVSPRLLACRDLELAIPGSYVPNQEIIKISLINSNLQVIRSKQRPRRLTIKGSDGKDYMFLLKGHEDLRQDERVMQLFGLVNAMLKSDPNTYRHDLAIQRYAVVPLSTNSGLIGWVPHCDTMYNLISDYREKKTNRVSLNTEQQLMTKMSSDLAKLMLMQKVEIFENALSQTPGNDLSRLFWLKSPSSEVWFERRTNYTRSLAVMSMVGYILGLGDRHPSNIMFHRRTGKVLHIDFGDCFEVTLTREKFPEKIPFRLTRMMINAMEVTGIEGTYRSTCESVMEVLHKNKDSVMAVLEAFVYDPLLNWRLVDTGRQSVSSSMCSTDSNSSTLPSRSHHIHMNESVELPLEPNLNKRALNIVNRIKDKLIGRDFPGVSETVTVPTQVDLLIHQATNNENLCQCYIGWCPFW